MAGNFQPLGKQFPIVNSDGTPNEYFIRWAQDRQIDIQGGISQAQLEAYLASIDINAGVGLSGGGNLSSDVTIDLENTTVTPGSYTSTNLTVDAQGRITAASNGSGGGGGGLLGFGSWMNGSFTAASAASLGVALAIDPRRTYTFYELGCVMTAASGGQYFFGVAPFNAGTNQITALPGTTPTTALTAGNLPHIVPLSTPYVIPSGGETAVLLYITRTDSTTSVSQSAGTYQAGSSPGMWLPNTSRGRTLTSLNPAVGNVWTVSASNFAMTPVYSLS